MARKGDGIYLRKNTWWLDAIINGRRYQMPLGKKIKRTTAAEIATAKRAGILKGEIGIARKKKDLRFEDGARIFLDWTKIHKGARTHSDYETCIGKLRDYF